MTKTEIRKEKIQLENNMQLGTLITGEVCEVIRFEKVKEAVLKYLDILNKIDTKINLNNEVFDEYHNTFGAFN